MQLLNISKLPIYLPYDKAPVPFGDPFSDVTYTLATPSVFTVKGYNPLLNDRVALSVSGGATLDTNFAAGTAYYAVNITTAAGTFSLSTVANGTGQQSFSTQGVTGGLTTIHLLSDEVDGVTIPFKPGNTVLAFNLGTAAVFLEGAPDLNTTTYGNPQGPGTAVLLATIQPGSAALVTLSQDWLLTTSAGPGTLSLVQN